MKKKIRGISPRLEERSGEEEGEEGGHSKRWIEKTKVTQNISQEFV